MQLGGMGVQFKLGSAQSQRLLAVVEHPLEVVAELLAAAGSSGPDPHAIVESAARHDLSVTNPEWIPELTDKYHLKLLKEP